MAEKVFKWATIRSIEAVAEEDVYDVEIEGTHNFVGNGIVAHNTYSGTASTTNLTISGIQSSLLSTNATGGAQAAAVGNGLTFSSNTLSTSFGTTTANTWTSLQAFQSGLLSQASSTFTGFTQLANASTTQLTNAGTTWLTSLSSAVLGVDTTGKVVATSSIGANLLSGTITNSQLANSSVTINSAGLLTGGGSVSLGGTLSLNASTSPTVGYVFATSTTASTLPYASSTALTISGTGFFQNATTTTLFGANLKECTSNNVLTWSAGSFGCEADDTGAGGAWPFTTGSYDGLLASATSTQMRFTGSPWSLAASSTFATQASTTLLTNTGNTYLTALTSALLGTDSTGKVVSTTTIGASLIGGTLTDSQISSASVWHAKLSSSSLQTSTLLAGLLSDETGSGNLVFSASPTLSGTLTASSILASASSTIGAGGQATGLTIFGGATTTGSLVVQGGATSTFSNGISSTYLALTGTAATSTAANGWNLTAGCFAVNGTCVGGGSTSFANPSASIGLTAVNGSASTAMRSDAAPALSQSIAPTWTALHQFTGGASSTILSVYNNAYFGATATSSFASTGALTLAVDLAVTEGGTGASTLTGLLQGNGTSAITGITGTAGQFPYYNGTNTLLATSSIYLATSGNVGIGTTSPGTLLSVGDTSGINFSTATSTWNSTGGINIKSGCFAVNGTCIGSSGYIVKLAAIYATTTPGTNASIVFTGAQGSAPSFSADTLTLPSNISSMMVEMIGGGGGGGGAQTAPSTGYGGGGGGGGYFNKFITSPTGTYRYTIASGGAGNTGSDTGTTGGNSCIASGGSIACNNTLTVATSTGGTGGSVGISGGAGGTGGSSAGGDVNLQGNYGLLVNGDGGDGGDSIFGFGGRGGGTSGSGANGAVGTYGGGGGGGDVSGGDGGAGGNGLMIITVYATSSPNAAGNDYAEMFPVSNPGISAGDIVAVDASIPVSMTLARRGERRPLAGVISTNPGHLLGDKDVVGQRPVALAGRVPVKFSDENGAVAVGDRITISSIPGVGMKAGPFDDSVGIVIAPVEQGENGDPSTGSGQATVMIFIDLHQGIDINSIALGLLGADAFTAVASSTASTTTSGAPLDFVGGMMHAITKRIALFSFDSSASSTSSGQATTTSATTTAATSTLPVAESESQADSYATALVETIFEKIKQWFADAANGIRQIFVQAIDTLRLTVGSSEQPAGITLYDEETGEPYCVKVRGGQLASVAGACTFDSATSTPETATTMQESTISSGTGDPAPQSPDPTSTSTDVSSEASAEEEETTSTTPEPEESPPAETETPPPEETLPEEPLADVPQPETPPAKEQVPPAEEEPVPEPVPEPQPEPESTPEPAPEEPPAELATEPTPDPKAETPAPEPPPTDSPQE